MPYSENKEPDKGAVAVSAVESGNFIGSAMIEGNGARLTLS